MGGQYGTITGVDRVNGLVGARLDGGLARWLPSGFAYRGPAPAPLSRCWFANPYPGQYVCEGPLGDSRIILHEDFTVVGVPAASVSACDTPWFITTNNLAFSFVQSTDTDQQGAVVHGQRTTNGNYASWHKDVGVLPPTPPAALWLSARWKPTNTALGTVLTTRADTVGLGDLAFWSNAAAGFDGVGWGFDTSLSATNYVFAAGAGGVATAVASAAVAADAFSWFDIVYVPGLWAAGWVDGDGPYPISTNIPDAATALAPGFALVLRAAVTRYQTIDTIHLEEVSEVVDVQLVLDGR